MNMFAQTTNRPSGAKQGADVTGSSRAAGLLRTGNAATIAIAAGAAYCLGSLIGLALRLEPATPSVLWPPNAILTVLLLFVPFARWWSALLGAAVAHFVVQLPIWSPWFVAAIFLTNCTEALLAAGILRSVSDEPTRFDGLRRVASFLVICGFLAPFVSTFLDAGVVAVIHGEDYWTVWKMRLLSNGLSQLVIVPAGAGILNGSNVVLTWPRGRWLEAAAIGAGLVVASLAVSLDAGGIGLSNSQFALFLPFLLWAAVRFGSTGVGLSVLGTVLVAVASALYGEGLFPMVASEDRIRTLHVFLISAAVPLLCLGAIVEERMNAVEALRSSDLLKSSILTSIPGLVAVIGRDGRIVVVNESWRAAREKGLMAEIAGEAGASYLDVWAAAADQGSANARAGYDGIMSVLECTSSGFTLEYSSDERLGKQWWMMSVVPLKSPEGGAVITHTDISTRKRAELEAQRGRDELAHATRVWVMGELTASLSHQLNQPLTGIVGNAHAARRFLEAAPPNLAEVHQILEDIIADAQRASDVTRAVRDMLRKDVSELELLDVNDVVRDTAMLVTSQAILHNVALRLQLAPSLPLVRGKRVQLRQVVLNLLMNAFEATDEQAGGAKIVIVRTEPKDVTGVQVAVVDTGCGLPEEAADQIFEPLFTTKESGVGMGMGLPIARAIVEAHGGTMWATGRPAGGTVFHFTIPLVREEHMMRAPAPV
jgi:signal transduction histidine kinase/integral membrane sensor domain MASE1